MIKVYSKDSDLSNLEVNLDHGILAYLNEASEVCIDEDTDGNGKLTYKCPMSEKWKYIDVDVPVSCDGKVFVITNINDDTITCDATWKMSGRHHLQDVPDYIGYRPRDMIKDIWHNSQISEAWPISESSLPEGISWITDLTDFFEMSKTTLPDCIDTIRKTLTDYGIHNELYVDNKGIAIVSNIGVDRGVRIDTLVNAKEIKVERDISTMITRLYPYGESDLHIGSVNNDVQYIESPNINQWPIHEGYMMFENITDPTKLKEVAKRQFDENNPERIDVPKYNITISNATRKYDDIQLGDIITVVDRKYGLVVKQRVTQRSYYPYEPNKTTYTLGGANQNGGKVLTNLLKQNLDYTLSKNKRGKVKTSALELSATPIYQIIELSAINTNDIKISDTDNKMSIDGATMKLCDNNKNIRMKVGSNDTEYFLELYDSDGNKTAYIDEDGKLNLTGATNSFETPDGKVVTVSGGVITEIIDKIGTEE